MDKNEQHRDTILIATHRQTGEQFMVRNRHYYTDSSSGPDRIISGYGPITREERITAWRNPCFWTGDAALGHTIDDGINCYSMEKVKEVVYR